MNFKKIKNFTIGADPEVFVTTLKGKVISAEGMLGGSKDNPKKLTNVGHYVQEDNVMCEFNIPPVVGENEFVRELDIAMSKIKSDILNNEYTLLVKPSAEFSNEELSTKQAKTIGCEPDINAYTLCDNDIVDLNIYPNTRFCGGHIHIGCNITTLEKVELIKCLDAFVGCVSNIIDTDEKRKNIYGQLGRFRIKDYGVEYRTCSNWWLESEETQRFIFQLVVKAIEYYNKFGKVSKKIETLLLNNKYAEIVDILNINLNEKCKIQKIKDF